MIDNELIFLKLGGSLITDKNVISTAKFDVLERIAGEIFQAIHEFPDKKIVIGHGSGSFGHQPANKYNTRAGVYTKDDWLGFTEVWRQANALNRIVVDIFSEANLPVVSFPPSSSAISDNGKIIHWNINPIQKAIDNKLIPIIQGDVVLDNERGGTIVSTEEFFSHLAKVLQPKRILLAGIEPGVWEDYPTSEKIIKTIDKNNIDNIFASLSSSESVDVTGGMKSKVVEMISLINQLDDCEAEIFSGTLPNSIFQILAREKIGTKIFKMI